tara:strand:- start:167 stop:316 length:150 start_codon:yes stop_codon:yes gene_type:complete
LLANELNKYQKKYAIAKQGLKAINDTRQCKIAKHTLEEMRKIGKQGTKK